MKKLAAKLNLNRETLQQLQSLETKLAKGGLLSPPTESPEYC